MLTEPLANALIDTSLTVLILAALVITCAAMTPPRPPRGPHR
ncbi:hypothetical protein [Actinokineospora iranica]|uniref:Uncharacterized protein n=1 Tax=Actinokineospora iranica TaxID=1271860 RepID=A0A1G6UGU8_9PSEU|nr:hypothetical protein [Actinokineospora iranica]SDD39807.1 hypothetical protein SAMN05216174_110240 [Actinokineospora iranica]